MTFLTIIRSGHFEKRFYCIEPRVHEGIVFGVQWRQLSLHGERDNSFIFSCTVRKIRFLCEVLT